jgi:hypothetical protein
MNELFAEARAAPKFMAAASVLGRLVETLADVLAARGFDHATGNVTLDMLPSE